MGSSAPNISGMCAPGPGVRGLSARGLSPVLFARSASCRAASRCSLRSSAPGRRARQPLSRCRSGALRPSAAPGLVPPAAAPALALCARFALRGLASSLALARSSASLRASVAALWSPLLCSGRAVGLAPRAASSRSARFAALGPAGSAPGRTRAVGPLSFRCAARGFFRCLVRCCVRGRWVLPCAPPVPAAPAGGSGDAPGSFEGPAGPSVPAAPPGSVVPVRPVSPAARPL